MRLNMPQLIAAHQQLERTHLPTSFPPPTHSSEDASAVLVAFGVSPQSIHPHTHTETGSRARVAGEARGDSAVRKSRYLCHRVNLRSHFRPAFDPQIRLLVVCSLSQSALWRVLVFTHPQKNIAPRHCARPWSSCGLRGCRVGTVPRCATCFSCCCSRSAQGHTRQDYIRYKHGIILERELHVLQC